MVERTALYCATILTATEEVGCSFRLMKRRVETAHSNGWNMTLNGFSSELLKFRALMRAHCN